MQFQNLIVDFSEKNPKKKFFFGKIFRPKMLANHFCIRSLTPTVNFTPTELLQRYEYEYPYYTMRNFQKIPMINLYLIIFSVYKPIGIKQIIYSLNQIDLVKMYMFDWKKKNRKRANTLVEFSNVCICPTFRRKFNFSVNLAMWCLAWCIFVS